MKTAEGSKFIQIVVEKQSCLYALDVEGDVWINSHHGSWMRISMLKFDGSLPVVPADDIDSAQSRSE